MIVGIDSGYGYTKTKNVAFASSVSMLPDKQLFNQRVVEYEGKVYQVGTDKIGMIADKTSSDDYLILTLAAIGEELKALQPKIVGTKVTLAVGVPLMRYQAEKEPLIKYLKSKGSHLDFKYEGIEYNIILDDEIYVYPQGYAAIATENDISYSFTMVDIGTGTIDILSVGRNFSVDLANSHTVQFGINNLLADISEVISARYNKKIKTEQIIDIIIGKSEGAMPKIIDVVNECVQRFIDNVINILRANSVDYEFEKTIIMGGGAGILKRFGKHKFEDCNVVFLDDIKANAIGYEILAKRDAAKR